MSYENLHWYLEIENPDDTYQWKDLDGRNIKRFAFSNINFWNNTSDRAGATAGPYNLARLEDGGTAYYNLDLQLDSVLEGLPSNFFMNTKTEIPSFSFSLSSPWNAPNGLTDTGFWAQTVQLYNRENLAPLFLWDGAVVRLYLSNGQIPGLVYQGSNVWAHPDAGWTINWTSQTPYTITGDSKLYFNGFLRTGSEDVFRTPFSVDGLDRRLESPVGVKGRISDNSSAEIVPIPIGQAFPYNDGDNWAGFPVYHEDGNNPGVNLKTSQVDITGGLSKGLLFFDSKTNQQFNSTLVSFSDDSKNVSVAVDISGATLENSRTDSSGWNFTETERDNLDWPLGGTEEPHTQQLLIQNSEVVGLHSQDNYGASDPIIGSTEIIFREVLPRMETRGWGGTDLESHSAGEQYRGQTEDMLGGRINWIMWGPVSDFSDGKGRSPLPLIRDSRGTSGNVWDMVLRSEFRSGVRDGTEQALQISNTNFGPIEFPAGSGQGTGFRSVPCENEWEFYIRPRRSDFGTEDVIKGLYIVWDVELYARDGGIANEARMNLEYKDSAGVWQALELLLADNINQDFDSVSFTEKTYYAPIGAETIDEVFDQDWLRVFVRITSNYSSASYYAPVAAINGLKIGTLMQSPTAGKKIYWYGEGMESSYGTPATITDSSVAVKSLLITQIGYDEAEIDETTDTTNLQICGAVSEQDTMGSIVQKIGTEAQMLSIFQADGEVRLKPLTADSTFGTITDEMLLFDESTNTPEILYSSSDIMDTYTSIEVLFRKQPDSGDYMGSLVVDGDGWQNWIGQRAAETSPNVFEYNDYDWAQLTYGELITMKNLCKDARFYASKVGEQEKTLIVSADWIRDRATAESLFAKMTAWATRVRTSVTVTGGFESWADVKIGDQFEFGLSNAFQNPRTDGKQFIVSKKQTQPSGEGWGIEITLDELPIVRDLPSGV